MEYRHGGDIYTNQTELDYSANLNPLGMPEGVREAYLKAANRCSVYPDSRCQALKAALAAFHRIEQNAILCGNGAAELIFLLAQAKRPKRALLIAPSFLEYEQALKSVDCDISWFDLKEEKNFVLSVPELLDYLKSLQTAGQPPDMVFLCNPNNPTGFAAERGELLPFLEYCENNGVTCVLDECFNEFLDDPERYTVMEELRDGRFCRLFILKAFTKLYAMAGLRLGYGLSADEELLEAMERCRQPWSVSGPAQAAGEAALRETAYVDRTRRLIKRERLWLKGQLELLGLFVYDSQANYLFFRERPQAGEIPGRLYGACLKHGILIRSCANYRGLDSRYYRICVKDRKDNEAFIRVMKTVMEERRQSVAKAIMIQGTMSNAGKSLIAAGLCRIFKQDGYRVAPFKSQNMALNSHITEDGLEMGRAQAVQAEAAGIKPQADMNPILLKPTSDSGSQVIVNGVPIGNMTAREYFAYKKALIPQVESAYRRLEEEYEIIVIEGAGSPAEINLRQDDIVNMGMARMAGAPVLLVGDIDRGGVFAQLYGTVALLTEDERARVKGLVVNKFRGDKTILDPGITMLEELCGIPVTGVVPYADVDIEDEDSLGRQLRGTDRGKKALVDIAVVRLPRISNFTDFQIFTCIPEAGLTYVNRVSELGRPDLIILPGTKNTIEDLLWMRKNGLEAAVLKLASQNVPVFGVCGGFQMLGELLEDPFGVETAAYKGRAVEGLKLLPVRTVFGKEKTRTRVTGSCGSVGGIFEALSGMEIEGYEIHMGETARSVPPLSYVMEGKGSHLAKMDGCQKNHVYGTYIHGFFDKEGIVETVVNALLEKKGLTAVKNEEFHYSAYRNEQYDRLADVIRESFDMKAVYDMMGIRREEAE